MQSMHGGTCLQQDVEDVCVRLVHLIEQEHGIRPAPAESACSKFEARQKPHHMCLLLSDDAVHVIQAFKQPRGAAAADCPHPQAFIDAYLRLDLCKPGACH